MRCSRFAASLIAVLAAMPLAAAPDPCASRRTLRADVVALDQPFFWNRMGAVEPQGMIFALEGDIEEVPDAAGGPRRFQLRRGKRPRPLVLRIAAGDCLEIRFRNLLDPIRRHEEQPATRDASIQVVGLDLVSSIRDGGGHVGKNPSALVPPGGSATYRLSSDREGAHLMVSAGAPIGGEGDGGSISAGLFGAVVVEPQGSVWYRSQLTADDLTHATRGRAPTGQPLIDWSARYPPSHPRAGQPVLSLLDGDRIVHGDLTAIVAGGRLDAPERFPAGTYDDTPVLPDRLAPFREFVTIYHDESGAVQAFPQFDDQGPGGLAFTLHGLRDGFGINYGSSGAGSVVLANRLGVGPAAHCAECKYEEFFLSSWASGDPALVVDAPANSGRRATRSEYPDDPSNVYHSYLGDHVKFRVLHAGPKEHHIHHQHAHQWPFAPDSANSSYLDSQAIGPGSAYTLEMTYGGSGNRNLTPGDSIFHCHFYPHFAQGMWALWRVHDVFEAGTELDGESRPVPGSRALPDGEIVVGTPIPALVPLPTLAMAPLPTPEQPGYPFFIPGMPGHRPPHPPLDLVDDGGLPRHRIDAGTADHAETRLDFHKEILTAEAVELPEAGTPAEVGAMRFHAERSHASTTPEGKAGEFLTNGLPEVAGAPFADPCGEAGKPAGRERVYKAAAIELDATFNRAGWHYPQWRMLSLWGDVSSYLDRSRAPEPLFIRANSEDCVVYHHTVLTPNEIAQDDFQVRAPTDVLGQHIHLVKFDVLASDGAGNGWNYEDGTFSPDEVVERIRAIRAGGDCLGLDRGDPRDGRFPCPVAKAHPFFGPGPDDRWLGAQTTIQRWYADPLLDARRVDKTLRTVFTHDHFAPSSHQQLGLYAGLIVEPKGSAWTDPESGDPFGNRALDGGPTSWRANIETADVVSSYREFLLAFQDFALAYDGDPHDEQPINPPARDEAGLPKLIEPAETCPNGDPLPCPEAISAADVGTMLVNYRNEPLALRVRDPQSGVQAADEAGDLALAFSSDVPRADDRFNHQPDTYPPLTNGVEARDPWTPLIRAYEGDRVEIRTLVGAHEEGHNLSIHGAKWLFEPNDPNSGYRASQMAGLSEHFEMELAPQSRAVESGLTMTDRLVAVGSSVDDLWNGLWTILRTYRAGECPLDGDRHDPACGDPPAETVEESAEEAGPPLTLRPLPNNPRGKVEFPNRAAFAVGDELSGPCPAAQFAAARKNPIRIAAVAARDALPSGALIYNPRSNDGGALADPSAILYVRSDDLDGVGRLKPGVPIEPLILRGRAGDCLVVELENRLPDVLVRRDGYSTLPMIVPGFNANELEPSRQVGLHAELIAFDPLFDNGVPIGGNQLTTLAGPKSDPDADSKVYYVWYLGRYDAGPDGMRVARPIEFGAVALSPADPIKQAGKGAIGALIVEPAGATWTTDPTTRTAATVFPRHGGPFREFVLLYQDDVNLRSFDPATGAERGPIGNLAGEEDAEDSGQKAFNYRTEPTWKRLGYAPTTPLEATRNLVWTDAWSNQIVGGDPSTPVFTAPAGMPIRFRVVQPGGHQRNHVFEVQGHRWPQEPYVENSSAIGANPLSPWTGAQAGIGPSSHFDFVIPSAGGTFAVPGDYLIRDRPSFLFDGGLWGLLRVTPPVSAPKPCPFVCWWRRLFGKPC